jgi:23S rRNA (cytidine1920-2'-O)/16S rRNA (cytidine1409-2'-O)-methyltransferase
MNSNRRVLVEELGRRFPTLSNPLGYIESGSVMVNAVVTTNPRSRVLPSDAIKVIEEIPLRGTQKLMPALDHFGVDPSGGTALDVGASTGGFTSALIERGVRGVYAVDVGHGQLRGRLRQDPRVVNLERTNVADLSVELVPERIDLLTIDLSYLALGDALPQIPRAILAPDAQLLALVKPMFELALAALPENRTDAERALRKATTGATRAGWRVLGTSESPLRGRRGALEFFIHACRSSMP